MSHRKYNSLGYFAQEFVNFLRRPERSFRAEHHNNLVQFSIFKEDYSLEFLRKGEKNFVELEKKVEEGYLFVKRMDIEVKRSRSGRISGDYFSYLLKKLFSKNSNCK